MRRYAGTFTDVDDVRRAFELDGGTWDTVMFLSETCDGCGAEIGDGDSIFYPATPSFLRSTGLCGRCGRAAQSVAREQQLRDDEVVFAVRHVDPDVEAYVLFQRGRQLFEVRGSNCQCCGDVEGQWEPRATTLDVLDQDDADYGEDAYGWRAADGAPATLAELLAWVRLHLAQPLTAIELAGFLSSDDRHVRELAVRSVGLMTEAGAA